MLAQRKHRYEFPNNIGIFAFMGCLTISLFLFSLVNIFVTLMCALIPAFQEGVAVEIAEAVVGALRGELSATAVNAPMVPPEVKTPCSFLHRASPCIFSSMMVTIQFLAPGFV